jgi:hypothetical protein
MPESRAEFVAPLLDCSAPLQKTTKEEIKTKRDVLIARVLA